MSALLTLGLALFVAYPAGRLCARFSVPRVTGYLLAGILLGPSILARFAGDLPGPLRALALTPETISGLAGVRDLATALILFTVGTGLRADRIRSAGRATLALSAVEIALSFLGVAVLTLYVAGAGRLPLVLVLGAVGVATAPAATLLVMRELDSHGPVSRRIPVLVGIDNVASLLLFAVLFGSLCLGNPARSLAALGLGAVVGAVAGVVVSAALLRLASPTSFAVLPLAGMLTAFGLSRVIGADPLLACLVLGATLANASPHAEAAMERLRQADYPVYVVFFVLAGADLHLDLLLGRAAVTGFGSGTVMLLVVAYVAGRAAGKMLSGRVAARFTGERGRPARLTGLALMAQAGLAVSLADAAARSGAAEAEVIRTVVLASVAIFELVGPLCVRHALVHAGEVRILNLLPDRLREGLGASLADTLGRLRASLGLPRLRAPGDLSPLRAVDLMRRNLKPLPADARFEEVLHAFAAHPCDQFPVVGAAGDLLGVISFRELRTVLFDDALESLVVAADLVTGPGATCPEDATLPEVVRAFEASPEHCSQLVVVTGGDRPGYSGIIEQREAVLAYRRHHRRPGGN